jgi:hypothetical protein
MWGNWKMVKNLSARVFFIPQKIAAAILPRSPDPRSQKFL